VSEPLFSLAYDDQKVTALLKKVKDKVGDPEPAFREIGEYMLLSTDENFEKETDPYGVPWIPNSPYTLARKRAAGRIEKVLQNTGIMRASVTYQASRDRVIIGTNDKKAAKHQLGIGVPQRQFLGIGKEDKAEIIKILATYLSDPEA
jgi:phage virion morphogenesis protein